MPKIVRYKFLKCVYKAKETSVCKRQGKVEFPAALNLGDTGFKSL